MDKITQLQNCYALYQAGDVLAAEQAYSAIASRYPDWADAHHLGAIIARRAMHNELALERIERALSGAPNHHEYLNTKGNILDDLQDIPKAISAYRAALKARPQYLAATQNLGKTLLDYEAPLLALSVYQEGLKYHPRDSQLRLGEITALKDSMKNQAARTKLEGFSTSDDFAYLRGQIESQLGNMKAAIIETKKALNSPRDAGAALSNLAQIYWVNDQWEVGRDFIQGRLEQTPTLALFIAAASIFQTLGECDEATGILDRAQQNFGPQPIIFARRARILLDRGEAEQAFAQAVMALQSAPGDLQIMETFADCALASNRAKDALECAQMALKTRPQNQFWHAVKMTARRALHLDNHGMDDYETLIKVYTLSPPKGYASLAEFLERLKQTLVRLHALKHHPLEQSLRHGTQTPLDLRYLGEPDIDSFFQAIDGPIREYMNHIKSARDKNLAARFTGNYHLSGAWSVRLRGGGFHVNHVHPKGWISSAFYVDVPDIVNTDPNRSGWINFGEPPLFVPDKNAKLLGPEKWVKPEPGKLVLFPSYMWHGTVPLKGNFDRMTLPIDIVPM